MICLLCLITRNNHDLQSVSTMSVSQTVSGKESTQEDCVCSKVEFWVGGSTLPALKAFLCCWVTQSQVFSITKNRQMFCIFESKCVYVCALGTAQQSQSGLSCFLLSLILFLPDLL